MAKPFRFALQLHGPIPGRTWLDSAKMAEDLGFDSLLMPDHFTEELAPVPALAAAASVTTTLKVGALVMGNDYRHPAMVAKEMATLDVISGGRVELGIGAGWMKVDYDRLGFSYDPPAMRIDRLQESLDIIRKCWDSEPFSASGVHYKIAEYDGFPKPNSAGGPKIMIGGGGPRMLGLAARNADIVAVTANLRAGVIGPDATQDSMPAAYDKKLQRVRQAAGPRLDQIELSSLTMHTSITDDRETELAGVAELFGVPVHEIDASPAMLIGSVDQLVDQLIERRKRWGFNYIAIQTAEAAEAFSEVVHRLNGT